MKALFLDDMRDRHDLFLRQHSSTFDSIEQAFSYEQFVQQVPGLGPDDIMFLDHDLSEQSIMCDPDTWQGERTGTDVAKWIVANLSPEATPSIVIHTLNPVGRQNMADILVAGGFLRVSVVPFYKLCPAARFF